VKSKGKDYPIWFRFAAGNRFTSPSGESQAYLCDDCMRRWGRIRLVDAVKNKALEHGCPEIAENGLPLSVTTHKTG
jgi:hypothetical protein